MQNATILCSISAKKIKVKNKTALDKYLCNLFLASFKENLLKYS